MPATSQNLNVANAQAGSKARKEAMAADEAKLMAKQLEKVEVKIPVRIGDGGKLFGSVTGKDVSDALKKQHIDIDKRKIHLDTDIKAFGGYHIEVKLYNGITAKLAVSVTEAQ